MTLLVLSYIALGCAAIPALFYLWNSFLFRPPPALPSLLEGEGTARLSVLIPARNEEASIAACVESVLASRGVQLEVVVLDDHSEDRTADIVREMARKDPRVRLEVAPPLPDGWCGKQHACLALARLARYPILTFLDADVRLSPDALVRMAAFLDRSKAALVSGFPRQETGTFLERLVIPLINWLLLCYLPMLGMRLTRLTGFGAGCGQWFMTTREAYERVGGHAAVKASLHDGLTLPRAYRRAGFHTDICDATELAVCRMYRSARGVWFGLAKNAREGMAATSQVLVWTVLLFCGQMLPFILLPTFLTHGWVLNALLGQHYFLSGDPPPLPPPPVVPALAVTAGCLLSFAPRLHAAWRFRQSWMGAALHTLGVVVLLSIQWYAVYRAAIGRPVGWKGRAHPASA